MREYRAAGRTTAIAGGGRRKSDESLETVSARMVEGENSRDGQVWSRERNGVHLSYLILSGPWGA